MNFKRGILAVIVMMVMIITTLAPIGGELVYAATTYYVSPTGSNTNPGTLAQPWATIKYASQHVTAGDTIIARGGTYTNGGANTDCFWPLSQTGTAGNPITLMAYPGETPVITGSGEYGQILHFTSGNSYFVIDGITLQDTSGTTPVYIASTNNITLRNCTFRNNTGSGSIMQINNNSSYITVEYCTFDTSGGQLTGSGEGDGIYINGSNHCLIQNNYFTKLGHYSIDLQKYVGSAYHAYNNVIRNNTIEQHWGGGIGVIQNSYNNLIENNSIYYVGEEVVSYPKTGIQLMGDKVIVRKNRIAKTTAGNLPTQGIKAVDGSLTTKWVSGYSSDAGSNNDPQWIMVDLGATYNVNRVKLTWDKHATSYKIQTSTDGSVWYDRYSTTTGDGGVDDNTFTAVNARYVRVHGTVRADTLAGYSLWEFEVYSTTSPTINRALNRPVHQSSNKGPADRGISVLAYYLGMVQNTVNNRVYNNVIYKCGGPPLFFNQQDEASNTRNRILNNIFYYNRVSGPWEAYWPAGNYYNIFELYHAYSNNQWGTNFPNNNYFYNNLWRHADAATGEHPNESPLFYYDGNRFQSLAGWGKSLSQVQADYPSYFYGNRDGNVGFVNAEAGNFSLSATSAAIDAGAHLTTTTSAGTSTTTVPVADAVYFTDGYGIVSGDTVKIGSSTTTVTAVNYTTNTLTVSPAVTFSSGAYVDLPYNGNAPDMGVSESSYSATPPPTPSPTPAPVDLTVTAAANYQDTGYEASKSADNNTATRWQGTAPYGYIKLDLGSSQTVASLDIDWYNSLTQYTTFEIRVSNDASNPYATNSSYNGTVPAVSGFQNFQLTAPATGRYIYIIGKHNNTQYYQWVSINEIVVKNGSGGTIPVTSAVANNEAVGSEASKAIDGLTTTKWSGQSYYPEITFNAGSVTTLSSLKLDWYDSANRQYKYDVFVSSDGTDFGSAVYTGTSSTATGFQTISLNNVSARYVKVRGYASTSTNDSRFITLREAEVWGQGTGPTPTPSPTPAPTTIALQYGVGGYTGSKDVDWIVESTSAVGNYGVGQKATLYLRDNPTGNNYNALIYFDLSGQVPPGAVIDSATLSLYVVNGSYANGSANLHRITDVDSKGMWREGTTSAVNTKDGAAWSRRDGTNDTITTGWNNTAGSKIMDSAISTASGTIPFTNGGTGWMNSTDLTSDVQAWVNGTAVNQGWYIRVAGTGVNAQNNASNQHATASYRPKLTITYHTP